MLVELKELGEKRFNPAYARKSRLHPRRTGKKRIHPRTCGEKFCIASANSLSVDSSPHLRGKGKAFASCRVSYRFIPAPAGKSATLPRAVFYNQIHSCTCGEKMGHKNRDTGGTDSSPHLRGKVGIKNPGTYKQRFIPAPAGKSRKDATTTGNKQIHPRTCGEKLFKLIIFRLIIDSSPHLRGKDSLTTIRHHRPGFIPAPAGKSSAALAFFARLQIHPRTCGEKEHERDEQRYHTDSSPHLRGKDLVFTRLSGHCGMPLCNLHNLFFASSSTSNDFSYIFNMPKKIKN